MMQELAGIEKQINECLASAYNRGRKAGYEAGLAESKMNEKSYSDGLEDGMKKAWEVAGNILLQKVPSGFFNAFGLGLGDSVLSVITKNRVSEVIDKIKECEEKQDNERCCRCIYGCETGMSKHNGYCHECTAGSNYKEKQEELKVGDEVVNDKTGDRFVIIDDEIDNTGVVVGISNNYRYAQSVKPNRVRKTGRTFPQIVEVLEQIKEGNV